MDSIDRAIIDLLQADGRLTNLEVAHRVGLSPSPCLRRVRRLEEDGIITGYRAVLDPQAVRRGFDVVVYIDLSPVNQSTIAAFEAAVQQVEDVIECHRMVSKPDYLLRVAVADLAAYEQAYVQHLATLPAVSRITSQIAMKTVKAGARLPV